MQPLYRDFSWLQEQYITKKLSTIEIGTLCGCSPEPIRKYLHRFKLGVRSRSEALTGKQKTDIHLARLSESMRRTFADPRRHGSWKGGRIINKNGYVQIKQKDHPFADSQGYVPEHRLIAEEYLRRYLLPAEVVHHMNEIRNDNRPENLYVFPTSQIHLAHHRAGNLVLKSNLF